MKPSRYRPMQRRRTMRPPGYRPVQSWWMNRTLPSLSHEGEKLLLGGHAVCDVAPASKIVLKEDLVIGANLRKGSRAESYLIMKEGSSLAVNGRFQVFSGASLEVFPRASLSVGRGYLNTGAAIACACSITLGNEVYIARNVYITDSDHHKNSGKRRRRGQSAAACPHWEPCVDRLRRGDFERRYDRGRGRYCSGRCGNL